MEHGEQVIDVLGAEVDRIELEIKVWPFIAEVPLIEVLFLHRNSHQKLDTWTWRLSDADHF